jgi:hypothetical protein
MIGDTPRKDHLIKCAPIGIRPIAAFYQAVELVDALERELNAANERISKLYDYVAALETGGDLMAHELGFGYDVDLWNKARGESKP